MCQPHTGADDRIVSDDCLAATPAAFARAGFGPGRTGRSRDFDGRERSGLTELNTDRRVEGEAIASPSFCIQSEQTLTAEVVKASLKTTSTATS